MRLELRVDRLTNILFRLPDNNVNLGREEAQQCNSGRETDGEAHCNEIEHHVLGGDEIDGNKGEPNDTSAVHSEANVFGFIECFRNFASAKRVPRAHYNEQYGIEEADKVAKLT